MNTTITCRHGERTEAIEAYVSKKTARLPRFYDRISAIEVVLDQQKSSHHVEMIISVDHGDAMICHADDLDLYAAIDHCTDRAVRQLSDHKSRIRDDHH
ncbi:MAG: ribosome-associated translation inhibitor RaiA [Phycisphaerales bacterium]|nr:ribosome-associated translation inhibitor RaiA [Phycisphaerales bacterium]